MEKKEKDKAVAELKERISRANAVFLGEQRGLTVSEITKLRRALREVSGELKVIKNTLAAIALRGTDAEKLEPQLTGPTTIIFSYADQASVAKVLTEFVKGQEHFSIKAGMLGSSMMDVKGIEALAKLPGINQLRASILGVINAPATKLVRILSEPGAKLARVVKAHADKE